MPKGDAAKAAAVYLAEGQEWVTGSSYHPPRKILQVGALMVEYYNSNPNCTGGFRRYCTCWQFRKWVVKRNAVCTASVDPVTIPSPGYA
jgi:hypothetical protein